MAKRSVTTQVEEKQPRRTSGYLKTRRPSETVKAALDTVLLSYEEFESLTQEVAGQCKEPLLQVSFSLD